MVNITSHYPCLSPREPHPPFPQAFVFSSIWIQSSWGNRQKNLYKKHVQQKILILKELFGYMCMLLWIQWYFAASYFVPSCVKIYNEYNIYNDPYKWLRMKKIYEMLLFLAAFSQKDNLRLQSFCNNLSSTGWQVSSNWTNYGNCHLVRMMSRQWWQCELISFQHW